MRHVELQLSHSFAVFSDSLSCIICNKRCDQRHPPLTFPDTPLQTDVCVCTLHVEFS